MDIALLKRHTLGLSIYNRYLILESEGTEIWYLPWPSALIEVLCQSPGASSSENKCNPRSIWWIKMAQQEAEPWFVVSFWSPFCNPPHLSLRVPGMRKTIHHIPVLWRAQNALLTSWQCGEKHSSLQSDGLVWIPELPLSNWVSLGRLLHLSLICASICKIGTLKYLTHRAAEVKRVHAHLPGNTVLPPGRRSDKPDVQVLWLEWPWCPWN